jgi:hypothetical protein
LYPEQDLGLLVALAGGRTIFLRPGTVVESVFATADEELVKALFQRGSSLELLRRAIWFGWARNYGCMRTGASPAFPISVPELAALVRETAGTERVEWAPCLARPDSFWKRLRRNFRRQAA